MPIVLVRVDCRLIHGQVVETWLPHTGADYLLVANDDLVGNPFLRSVMEMAVPVGIRVAFCPVKDVPRRMSEIDRDDGKAILLCASSNDALEIFRGGVHFSNLNIGNLHYASGKVEIAPSVFFAREDFDAVDRLCHLGVSVTVRATPFEPVTRFGAGEGDK
jgi:D-glucosaminate PTS system EIIB component